MAGDVKSGYYTVRSRMKIVTKPGGQLPCKRHVETLVRALLLSPPAQFTDAQWDVHEVEIITRREVDGPE